MKKIMNRLFIAFLLSLLAGFQLMGQSSVTFTYDQIGNRTSREITPDDGASRYDAGLRDAPAGILRQLPLSDYERFMASGQESAYQAEDAAVPDKSASKADRPASTPILRNDMSLPVSYIPYSTSVTPSGGRIYTVPFCTASDFDLVPELALAYNSQAGIGVAGWGWNISGLSFITLRGRTLYYDGEKAPASLEPGAQSYSLDGTPLVPNPNPTLAQAYPYETVHGHIQVSRSTDGSSFTALRPDGSTAVYGTPGDTRPRVEWPLTQLTDACGNRIMFEYEYIGNTNVLARVRYGYSASGTDPKGYIQFDYVDRADSTLTYVAGLRISNKCILMNIISQDSGETMGIYALSYRMRDGVNEQLGVNYYARGQERNNPLLFETPQETITPDFFLTDDVVMPYYLDPSQGPVTYKRAKLLPGSFSDSFTAHYSYPSYAPASPSNHWSFYPSDTEISITPVGDKTRYGNITLYTGLGFQSIDGVDVDGDGADELIKIAYGGNCTNISVDLDVTMYDFGMNAEYDTLKSTLQISGTHLRPSGYAPRNHMFLYGDFSGGGHNELLPVSYGDDSTPSYFTVVSFEDGGIQPIGSGTLPFKLRDDVEGNRLLPLDIDADGVTELCVSTPDSCRIYRYLPSSGTFVLKRSVGGLADRDLNDTYYISDINADGYPDILTPPADEPDPLVTPDTHWNVFHYTGTCFERSEMDICRRPDEHTRLIFLDVDRDGYADLVRAGVQGCYVHRNVRGTISDESSSIRTNLYVSQDCDIIPANLVNWRGASCFVLVQNDEFLLYRYTDYAPTKRQVRTFYDSKGLKHVDYFADMSEHDLCTLDYYRYFDADSGYFRETMPLQLLEASLVYLPYSPEIPQYSLVGHNAYSYRDPVINSRGLGFCGFGEYTDKDILNSTDGYTARTTTVTDPEKLGQVTEVYSPGKHTVCVYDDHRTPLGYLDPRLEESVETDSLSRAITVTDVLSYDSFGLATSSVTEIYKYSDYEFDPDLQYTDSTFVTYLHGLTPSKFFLGIPTEQRQVRVRTGRPRWQKRGTITYDTVRLLPLETKEYVGEDGNGLVSTTRMTYDTRGKLTSKSTAPYGATTFTGETYTYDALGRHLASSTDVLGLSTTYSDYDLYGQPHTVTDHRGRTISRTFDIWGNILSETAIDGTVTTWCREWCPSYLQGTAGENTVIRTTEATTGHPTRFTYSDALDREVKSGEERMDGSILYTAKRYDTRGNVFQQSLPFKTASASSLLWTTMLSDEYGRPVLIQEPSGRQTVTEYADSTITVTKDGLATSRYYDSVGALFKSEDAGGVIRYSYRSDGQLDTLIAPGNVLTVCTFDDFGRRTKIIDPSAGERTFGETYATDGSRTAVKGNNAGSVIDVYDRYGRKISSATTGVGAISTSYSYDSDGLLTEVTSTNKSVDYTYDAYDRVVAMRESSPNGMWYQESTTYGAGGQPSGRTFTSDRGTITSESYTYGYGTLKQILARDGKIKKIIWQLQNENDQGLPTTVHNGSNYRRTEYDSYGRVTQISDGIINMRDTLGYLYNDATNNIVRRHDNRRFRDEIFTYDSLDRLTGSASFTPSYASNGNVTAMNNNSISYTATGSPYRATEAQMANTVAARNQQVTYGSYNRPITITEAGHSVAFQYDADYALSGMTTSGQTTYYYGDRYEVTVSATDTTEVFYLGGTSKSSFLAQCKDSNGQTVQYTISRDLFGTPVKISRGSTVQENYYYDPWGHPLNPTTWKRTAFCSAPERLLGRGFCGHLYLADFGLYLMGARLYDPAFGRFLSPDPYVQSLGNTQNLNRYSYALNNPLKYTDPSGEFVITTAILIGIISSACIGAGVGAYSGYKIAENKGYEGKDKVKTILFGGIIGATAWAATAYVGAAVGASMAAAGIGGVYAGAQVGAVAGAVGGTISGYGMARLQGFNPIESLGKAIVGASAGALSGALLGGLIQGTVSACKGNDFWDGSSLNQSYSKQEQLLINKKAGKEAVEKAIQQVREAGGDNIVKEVSLDVNNTRVRVDFSAKIDNEIFLFEIKSSPTASFTKNQLIAYPHMLGNAPIIPVGNNASISFGPSLIGNPLIDYNFVIWWF